MYQKHFDERHRRRPIRDDSRPEPPCRVIVEHLTRLTRETEIPHALGIEVRSVTFQQVDHRLILLAVRGVHRRATGPYMRIWVRAAREQQLRHFGFAEYRAVTQWLAP